MKLNSIKTRKEVEAVKKQDSLELLTLLAVIIIGILFISVPFIERLMDLMLAKAGM